MVLTVPKTQQGDQDSRQHSGDTGWDIHGSVGFQLKNKGTDSEIKDEAELLRDLVAEEISDVNSSDALKLQRMLCVKQEMRIDSSPMVQLRFLNPGWI